MPLFKIIKKINCLRVVLLLFLSGTILLSGCQQLSRLAGFSTIDADVEFPVDTPEYGCSYFYFLWGRQAELRQRYEEALEAYEKALICDPEAYYIIQKISVLFIRMGRNEEAITWLNRYLVLYPDESGSRMLLAKVLIRLSRFAEAAIQYRLIAKQNPDDHSALLMLGEMYLSQRNYTEAEKTFYEVLAGNDLTYGAHVLLSQTYRAMKEYDKSLEHYELALVENWSVDLLMEIGELFLEQKKYSRALEQYQKVLAHDENNEKARASRVHVYLLQKKHNQALAELDKIREYSDNPTKIDLAIAKIYISMNLPGKAISVLHEMLKVEEEPEARFLLGYLFFQEEKYEESLGELNRVSADSISYRESVFLRIRIYRIQNKINKAISFLEEIVKQQEGRSSDMYIMLAVLYQQQEKFKASQEIFSQGIAAYTLDFNILYEFGLFLDSKGESEKAMDMMEKVIKMKTDHAAALNYIGYTWADKGINLSKALEYINRAVKLKPENGYIRDSLGWIYFRLGRLKEARAEIEKAIKISGEDSAIYEHLGDINSQLGKHSEALEAYRKSIEFSSDSKAQAKVLKKIEALEKLEKAR